MKNFIFFIIIIGLNSCLISTPLNTLPTNNPAIKVELLFEVDGCKVYRFDEFNTKYYKYFTKCSDASNSSVGWIQSCGKNCRYYTENISSYERKAFNLPEIKK